MHTATLDGTSTGRRMRERHNWATGKHPKTCTCATCQQRRAEAAAPRPPKKKRKPKSQRGKKATDGEKIESPSALDEAMDIFGFSATDHDIDDESDGPSGGEGKSNDQ